MATTPLRIKLRGDLRQSSTVGSTKSQANDVTGVKRESRSAICMRNKREKLKKDPIAYAKYKAEEAERQRIRRKCRTEEQKQQDRERSLVRTHRYFAKKKGSGAVPEKAVKKPKLLTRSEKKTLQEYWREHQITCREKKSAQKRRWEKAKDRERHRKKREEAKANVCSSRTGDAEVPKQCRKRLQFVRKQAWRSLLDTIKHLKTLKDNKSRQQRRALVTSIMIAKKYRLQRYLAEEVGVRPNYISRQNATLNYGTRYRKTRSDATSAEIRFNVKDFYCSICVSRELPYLRTVKNMVQRRVMETTVEKAYQMWKDSNPGIKNKVSETLFYKLRPQHVYVQQKNRLLTCLCEYCTEIMMILKCFNQVLLTTNTHNMRIKDKYELIGLTLCDKAVNERHHKIKCINRQCPECGTTLLQASLTSLLGKYGEKAVTWQKWQVKNYEHDGQIKTKKVLVNKDGTLTNLVEEMVAASRDLAKHLFVASWQHQMYSFITKGLPDKWVVCVLDFAENYSCIHQDEIQSAHWTTQQVTIHPTVVFYRCEEKDHTHIVQEAIVFVSSDLKHDSHAVQHFRQLTINHLKEKRHIDIDKLIEFTDGCSAQYKSKGPFADISYANKDFNIDLERHFFGSRHGKGPSDGVSGVVKSAARRAVLTRKVLITNAQQLYNFCHQHLQKDDCTAQRRAFYYVTECDITRQRPDRAVKTSLPGTRSFHSVRSSAKPGVVDVRLLSCFCKSCIKDQDDCQNSSYVIPWQRRELKMVQQPAMIESCSQSKPPPVVPDMIPIEDVWHSLTSHDSLGDDDMDNLLADDPVERLVEQLLEDADQVPEHVCQSQSQANRETLKLVCGGHVLMQHGRNKIPAVITSDDPLGVTYFSPSKGSWIADEVSYQILPEDIITTLDEPQMTLCGSRIYYKFNF